MRQYRNIPLFLERHEHLNKVIITKIREGELGNNCIINARVKLTMSFYIDIVLFTKVGNRGPKIELSMCVLLEVSNNFITFLIASLTSRV